MKFVTGTIFRVLFDNFFVNRDLVFDLISVDCCFVELVYSLDYRLISPGYVCPV